MFLIFKTIPLNLELFLWMLGSFLIGYIFSMLYYKNNTNSTTNTNSYINSENSNDNFKPIEEDYTPVIRAKKTIERGGIEIKEPQKLSFKNIGKASEENKNDLTQINGINTIIEQKLNTIGIFTFEQLSKLSEEETRTITDLIQLIPGRIKRDNWKNQAKLLIPKKDDNLNKKEA